MGAPSFPDTPDPKETAAAQTSANISTAQANAILGNVDQVTPQGTLTYTAGTPQFIADENGQQYWQGPDGQIQEAAPEGFNPGTTTTSKENYQAGGHGDNGLFSTGSQETTTTTDASGSVPEGWSQVTGYYVTPQVATQEYSPGEQAVYESGLAARQNLSDLAASQSAFLQDYLGRPMDLSGAPAAGDPSQLSMPNLPTYERYAAAPELATTFGDAGAINSNYLTSFGDAGNINKEFVKQFDDAGEITRTYNGDFSEDRQRVEDALMERLQPYLDRKQESMRSQLLNSGIRQGSTAYSGAQADFDRAENDARIANILAASEEQSRLVGMERDRAAFENAAQNQDFQQKYTRAAFENQGLNFENDAQAQEFGQLLSRANFTNQGIQLGNVAQEQRFRQLLDRATFGNTATQQNFLNQFNVTGANNQLATQGFQDQTQLMNAELAKINAQNNARSQYMQEQYAQRSQPINEIGALLGTGQVQSPSFVNANTPTVPTTDVAGLINENYNQQLQQAQIKSQATQGLLGGLFGLGASALMASDKRVKKDVKKVGNVKGTGLYEFRYKGEDRSRPKTVGFMAQDIEKKNPDAVIEVDGVKHINVPKTLNGLFALGAS